MPDTYDKPTPPPVPKVDRKTGAVSNLRTEDRGQLDGWIYSETPDDTFQMGPDFCRPNQADRGKATTEKSVDPRFQDKI